MAESGMSEAHEKQIEEAYARGEQRMALTIIREASRCLGPEGSDVVALNNAREQLHEARVALRSMFEEFEWEWPGDDLNLSDVIEKHVYRHIRDED